VTIEQLRVLTSDLPLYDRATAQGDGQTKEYQIVQYPVIEGSATVYVNNVEQPPEAYTLDTEVGLITFATPPAGGATIVVTYRHAILSDANYATLQGLYPDTLRAAAAALDTIASNEALVQKKIRSLDLQTDGPAVAKELRAHAAELRRQAEEEDTAAGDFEVAEMVFDDFGRRERFTRGLA
jgi:hypothetical protein